MREYNYDAQPRVDMPATPVTPFRLASLLLVVAVVFGGGGIRAPLSEMGVELVALVIFCIWWVTDRKAGTVFSERVLCGLVAAFLAAMLLQVVPLPPAIWHELPAREVQREALALVGRDQSWMPLSVAPYRTIGSLLGCIPPLVLLMLVLRLTPDERTKLVLVLLAVIVVAGLVAGLQALGGDKDWLRIYDTSDHMAKGFQANRNAGAMVLLVGLLALAALASSRSFATRWAPSTGLSAAIGIFLVVVAILTGSRAGVLMLVPVSLGVILILVPRIRLTRPAIGISVVALGAVALLAILASSTRLDRTFDRFKVPDVSRPAVWEDTVYAIKQYWPVGSGMGTFNPVIFTTEALEVVDETYPNRAHNDYLELFLELGILAPIFLILALGAIVLRARQNLARKDSATNRAHTLFALSVLAVFALHSMVDYPMRTISVASIAALAVGLLYGRRRLS